MSKEYEKIKPKLLEEKVIELDGTLDPVVKIQCPNGEEFQLVWRKHEGLMIYANKSKNSIDPAIHIEPRAVNCCLMYIERSRSIK